ncbi:MAG: Sortase [Candidatus Roizmanbacteria bacterium GW2011_GWA2_37_7]|uniref:Sortase n=1 Tax=Candidatus Roizmanbacteria bacterium GW2011_GWA2_37_7 TaxID=1618481 RepID=A0A0G0KAS9_9BACT|nr:MAG: Sortase [Candidatus Roizmanbacteria bacterium GW2011_GWA2_37_7]
MIGKTFYQPVREELRYLYEQQTQKEYIVATNETEAKTIIQRDFGSHAAKGSLREVLERENVGLLIPADPNFSIVIPKIAANAPVIANVDAGDREDYLEALKKGVAQAQGSAFPGEGGHIYMFAHSTDYVWNVGSYNAVFYLLYKLETGDEVDIFYKGQRFVYKVTGKEIVNQDEVEYIIRKTDKEFLTLQTCWPPGTTLKRQMIFAERVVENK